MKQPATYYTAHPAITGAALYNKSGLTARCCSCTFISSQRLASVGNNILADRHTACLPSVFCAVRYEKGANIICSGKLYRLTIHRSHRFVKNSPNTVLTGISIMLNNHIGPDSGRMRIVGDSQPTHHPCSHSRAINISWGNSKYSYSVSNDKGPGISMPGYFIAATSRNVFSFDSGFISKNLGPAVSTAGFIIHPSKMAA